MLAGAWHTASLMRAKKFPGFDKFLSKPARSRRRSKPRSWEQQLAAWTRFTERSG